MNGPFEFPYFASVQRGLESLLLKEISSLSPEAIKEIPGGVYFSGSIETALRGCLWSRSAGRIFYKIAEFPAESPEELYAGCRKIAWDEHMTHDQTFAVSGNVASSSISHSHFAAMKVKDAIADHFRETTEKRPSVETERPDLQFNVFINKNRATINLDLSGESLHRRGYRKLTIEAPMKENLAAAILLFSRWEQIARESGAFVDLMCGSGTFPIEAAMIAGDIAPGLSREYYGFLKWRQFDAPLWENLLEEAHNRKRIGLEKIPPVYGFDPDPNAIEASMTNAEQAGVRERIVFERKKIHESVPIEEKRGLVFANPPYGARLGETSELKRLYEQLGERLRLDFLGWDGAVFSGNPELTSEIRLRPRKVRSLSNGGIDARLLHYDLKPEIFYREDKNLPPEPLSEGAIMFKNRLEKNLKTIGKWARKNGILCFRLYDADMPQYALAIDLYETFVHVQEYQAPASIEEKKAKKRFREALTVIEQTLAPAPDHLFVKVRKKQKGKSQYTRHDDAGEFHVVHEGKCKFLVNFTDYLDTGLFLDHRKTRDMISQMAAGKDFLNLFAYTGTASVNAAAGGAKTTTTVDLSSTYVEWARKNMRLNGFYDPSHIFIQDDCLEWIYGCDDRYDLIFLDPPTFSNSKRMERTFDVQRDHAGLIQNTMNLLRSGGTLIFSNNLRTFKIDETLTEEFDVKNITRETIQKDFDGNPKIHNCWLIRMK